MSLTAHPDRSGQQRPDVIVVGGGAAGGFAALLLAEAGADVLLLDAGSAPRFLASPLYFTVGHLVSWVANPGLARLLPPRLIHVGQRLLRMAGSLHQPVQTKCYAWERAPHLFVDDRQIPYDAEPDRPFNWIRAHGLGGRMVVPGHGRQYYRLSRDDLAPTDGESPPWPLEPGELDVWYERAEAHLRLSGRQDGLAEVPDSLLAHVLEKTVTEAAISAEIVQRWPQAKPILSRYAAPLAWLEPALATGRLSVRTGAVAQEIRIGAEQRVEGVSYFDKNTGKRETASAPIVFLCASTLESTRILMNSQTAAGAPLPGLFDALGRYLMDHVTLKAEGIVEGVPSQPETVEDGRCLYLPRFDQRDGSLRSRGYGIQLYHSPAQGSRAYFTAVAFGEMLPTRENHVRLHPHRKDVFGAPTLVVDCHISPQEDLRADEQGRALAELADLAKARLHHVDIKPMSPGTSIHECGTARMGRSPAESVLDPHNQCWAARGLYVTDGASFPSQGAQNPTLTIMALTARACSHALSQMGHREAPAEPPKISAA